MKQCRACKTNAVEPRISGDFCFDCWYKPFPITYVCRDDVAECFTPNEIARVDMEWLATSMAGAYCGGDFWIDLNIFAQEAIDGDEAS